MSSPARAGTDPGTVTGNQRGSKREVSASLEEDSNIRCSTFTSLQLTIVCGNEGHDSDHGESAIVQFSVLLDLQSLSAHPRKINGREDNCGVRTTLHVVSSLRFRRKLGNEDGPQDLSLSSIWDSLPCVKRLHCRQGFEGDVLAEHAREMDTSSLDDVSSSGKHGNTAVLQFRGTEPSQSLLTSNGGVAKRVELFDRSSVTCHIIQAKTKLGAETL